MPETSAGPSTPLREVAANWAVAGRRLRTRASEVFASHQLVQRFGEPNAPIFSLMILEQRHEDAWRRERRIVERVRNPHLPVGAAVADVGAPRLQVVQRRAAVGLAIFGEARD